MVHFHNNLQGYFSIAIFLTEWFSYWREPRIFVLFYMKNCMLLKFLSPSHLSWFEEINQRIQHQKKKGGKQRENRAGAKVRCSWREYQSTSKTGRECCALQVMAACFTLPLLELEQKRVTNCWGALGLKQCGGVKWASENFLGITSKIWSAQVLQVEKEENTQRTAWSKEVDFYQHSSGGHRAGRTILKLVKKIN